MKLTVKTLRKTLVKVPSGINMYKIFFAFSYYEITGVANRNNFFFVLNDSPNFLQDDITFSFISKRNLYFVKTFPLNILLNVVTRKTLCNKSVVKRISQHKKVICKVNQLKPLTGRHFVYRIYFEPVNSTTLFIQLVTFEQGIFDKGFKF